MLLEFIYLREERHVVLAVELAFLKGEELLAVIRPLGDLFGPLFDVDDVSILDELVELVELLLLHGLDLGLEPVKEVNHLPPYLGAQVEVLTLEQ